MKQCIVKAVSKRALMGSYEMTYCGYKRNIMRRRQHAGCLKRLSERPYLTGTYRRDKVQLLTVNTRVAIWRALCIGKIYLKRKTSDFMKA